MKKLFIVALTILLLAVQTTVAFAAEPYNAEWVPPIPDFIVPVENGFKITCNVVGEFYSNSEVTDFWNNKADEFIVLLDQGVYNRYKEENNIDYDRQFSIYVVAPYKKSDGSYYDFGAFMHKGGPRHQEQMNIPSPMMYMCLDSPHGFMKYIYDANTNSLVLQPGLSNLPGGAGAFLRFTYVLAAGSQEDCVLYGIKHVVNGDFSEPEEVYPGFSQVSGKDFGLGTIYHQFIDGKTVEHWRDYDWWIGITGDEEIPPYNSNLDNDQDTDGDGKPDINIDTDGDGNPDINIDTDGDGDPDINIDTDGDGKADLNIDTDGDGKADLNIDTDGDKKPDINIDTNGDGKADLNIDTDGDGKADLNIDTDGDKKPDINIDTDGDGKADLNIDTDGDKKPDLNVDTNGDGKADENVDIDGDGKPDVNVKPGSSSSGGSSSGGSDPDPGDGPGFGGGSGSPDTWFEKDDDLNYNDWEFFNPFKYSYTPFPWNKDYDPLEGYDPGRMPDFPKPGNPNSNTKDPFDIPNSIKFKDFAIEFGGK